MPEGPPTSLTPEEMDSFQQQAGPPQSMTVEQMSQQTMPEPVRQKYTGLESGTMGTIQGATFDLADEGEGAVKALYDVATGPEELKDLLNVYQKRRDQARKRYGEARQDNPKSYIGGQVGGSIATGFVPGLGWMNAAKGAKLGTTLGKAGLSGGVGGLGASEAEVLEGDIAGAYGDIGEGVMYGAGTAGALKGLGAGVKALNPRNLVKKGANVLLNTPEELTELRLDRGKDAIMNAPKRHELVGKYKDILGKLKTKTIEGSKGARDQLEGVEIGGSEIKSRSKKISDYLKKRAEGVNDDPEKAAARGYLDKVSKDYGPKVVPGEPGMDVHHGTYEKFAPEDIRPSKGGHFGPGVYTAKDKAATGNYGDVVHSYSVDPKKFLDVSGKELTPETLEALGKVGLNTDNIGVSKYGGPMSDIMDEIREKFPGDETVGNGALEKLQGLLKEKGFIGMKFSHNSSPDNFVIFDKANLKPPGTMAKEATTKEQLFSGSRIKDLLQSIDRSVDYEIAPGKFGKIDQGIKKEFRKDIDDLLKSKSPEYAESMKQVAKDAGLLDKASKMGSEKTLANVFRRIETDEFGAGQFPREIIEEVDARMGTDLLDQVKLSYAREAFDKSITQGSMNVNKFRNLIEGLPFIGRLAGFLGSIVDKYGRQVTMGAIDGVGYLETVYKKSGANGFAEAAEPLITQAAKGNIPAAVALEMMHRNHPELNKGQK